MQNNSQILGITQTSLLKNLNSEGFLRGWVCGEQRRVWQENSGEVIPITEDSPEKQLENWSNLYRVMNLKFAEKEAEYQVVQEKCKEIDTLKAQIEAEEAGQNRKNEISSLKQQIKTIKGQIDHDHKSLLNGFAKWSGEKLVVIPTSLFKMVVSLVSGFAAGVVGGFAGDDFLDNLKSKIAEICQVTISWAGVTAAAAGVKMPEVNFMESIYKVHAKTRAEVMKQVLLRAKQNGIKFTFDTNARQISFEEKKDSTIDPNLLRDIQGFTQSEQNIILAAYTELIHERPNFEGLENTTTLINALKDPSTGRIGKVPLPEFKKKLRENQSSFSLTYIREIEECKDDKKNKIAVKNKSDKTLNFTIWKLELILLLNSDYYTKNQSWWAVVPNVDFKKFNQRRNLFHLNEDFLKKLPKLVNKKKRTITLKINGQKKNLLEWEALIPKEFSNAKEELEKKQWELWTAKENLTKAKQAIKNKRGELRRIQRAATELGNIDNEIRQVQDEIRDLESQLDSTTKQAKQEAYAKIRKELYDSSYQPGFDKAWGIINNGLSKAIQIKEFEEAFDKLNSLDDYWFTTVGKSIVGFFDHNELKDLQNQKAYLEKLTQAVIKVEPWNSNQNFNKILAAYLNSLSKISSLKPLVPQIQHSISIAREAYQKTKLIEIPIPANDWDWDDSEFNKALAEIKQTQAEYKIKTEQTEVNEITKEFEKIAEEHQKAQKKDENNAKNQESEELWSFSSVEDIEAFFKESLGDNLTRQIGELWKNVAQIEPIYNDTIFNLALEEFIKGIKALDLWKIDQKSLIQVLRQGIITKRKAYQTTQEETLKDSRTKFHKQFDNTDYLSLKAITEKQATLKDKQARRNALEWRYKNQTKAYNRIAKIQQELVPGNNLDNNLTEAQAKYKTAQIKLQTAEKAFETQRNIMIQNESLVKYSRTLAGQLILADAYPEEQWNKDVGLAQKNNLVEQDTKKDLAAKMVEAGKEKTTIPEALKDAIDELPTEMKIVGIVLTILTLKGRPDLQKILGGIGLAGLVGHLWIKASTWGEMGLWDLFEGGVEQLKGAKNLLSAIQKVEYRNVLMKLLEKDPNNAKNVVALTFIAVETKLPELIKPDNTGYLKKQPDGKVTVDDAYFTEITSHEFTAEDGTKVNIWDYFDKIWIWPEHFQDAIQMFLMQVAPDKQAGTAYTMIQDKLNWGNPQTYDPTWEGYSILDVAFNSIESPLEKARELQKDEKERLEQIEINKFKKAFEALGLKIVKDIKKEKGVFVASLLDYKLTDIKFVDGKLTFVCEGFDSDNNSSNGIQGWDKNNVEDLKEKIQTKEFEKIKSLFPTDFGRTFGLNFENGNFNLGKEKSDDVDFIEFTMKSDNTNFETVQYMRDGKLYVINEFEIYGNEMKGNIWIEKYSIPIILDSNWDITFWNWIKYIDSALENARKWSQELIQKKLEKLLEDKKNEITNAFKVAVKDISTKKTFGWNDVDFYTSLWEKFTKNNLTNKTTKEDVEVYANFVIDLIQIYEGKLSKWGISILNNELPWLHLDKVMLKEYEISQLAEFLKNTPLENFSRTPKFYIDHSSGELLNAKTSNITPNKLIDAIEDWSGNDNDAENSFKPEIKAFFEELLKWAKWQSDEDLYKAYLKANLSLKLEKAYTHNYLNPDKYVLKTELGDLGKNNKWDFTKLGLKTYEEWKKPSDNAFGINQTPQQALGLTDALYNSYFTQKWYKIEKNDTSGTFDIKYKGNVLSVLDWKKLKIDNYELDQWYEINDTPFKILALMEEVKTKKTFSSNYSAFDHYSNRIEFQIDWHNSPKVNLAWENSDFIKKTTRLLSYWYFGWNSFTFSQTKDEFVWRYKEIESFYSNNKATLNNIITEIRQKYLRTENPCSGFYLQKDDIMVSIDMGADKNIKEICKSINFSLFGWKEYYLMLALNRAWFETN